MKILTGSVFNVFLLAGTISIFSCVHKPRVVPVVTNTGYPKEIESIIVARCATAGCHNAASYINAGELLLDSWEHLLNGGSSGAVIVPFNSKNSSLLYIINTDSTLGITAKPTMPYDQPPLTRDEYLTIKNWVEKGAPDKNGNIAFASYSDTRQKLYITQQGCDLVAVIDAEKKVVMRYIPIGMSGGIEAPHFIRVSQDGQYAYVSFLGGQYIQKIDTRTDTVIGSANVGIGSWNAFLLSPDGKQLIVSNWQGNGGVAFVNTDNMQVTQKLTNIMSYPHGIAHNISFDTFFITAQYGNTVYKFSPAGFLKEISIDEDPAILLPRKRDPHIILMHPDYSRYFLTCEASNEIRVMDAFKDTLIKAIPVGLFPQEMVFSKTKPYLFITCTEDNSSFAGYRGSVYVVNYNTLEIVKRIDGRFYQPHAISVDDNNGLVYIVSRNANPNGPAPHHASSCGGRNGYYNIYDLQTLEPILAGKRFEVSNEPYSSDIRFK